MLSNLYFYRFFLTRVIDADTLVGNIDLGFNLSLSQQRIRLYNIDAPEIRGKEKKLGRFSSKFTQALILNYPLFIKSYDYDSFGRIVADVFIQSPFEFINLSQLLVDLSLAHYI